MAIKREDKNAAENTAMSFSNNTEPINHTTKKESTKSPAAVIKLPTLRKKSTSPTNPKTVTAALIIRILTSEALKNNPNTINRTYCY